MIIVNVDQVTPEWFKERAGHPSASQFSKLVTSKGVRTTGNSRKDYLYTLAGERIIEDKEDSASNFYMQRGSTMEEEARNYYEFLQGVDVKQVGLVYPSEDKLYSCSPDGLLQDRGIEIKCPSLKVHVDYLLKGKLPASYVQQVQGSMLVTGFDYYQFMSYYPGMPPLILTVERDANFCDKLEAELIEFCEELDELEKTLRSIE